jgi:cytochrome c biogenesis protein CcdA
MRGMVWVLWGAFWFILGVATVYTLLKLPVGTALILVALYAIWHKLPRRQS